jgi:hypothetical protein
MNKTRTFTAASGDASCLVTDLLQVLAQLGDAVEGVGCLHLGAVVGDQQRLGGLVGYDALLALFCCVSVCTWANAS